MIMQMRQLWLRWQIRLSITTLHTRLALLWFIRKHCITLTQKGS
jgi:hypothetical protein